MTGDVALRWYGVLGATALWAVHLVAAYALVLLMCPALAGVRLAGVEVVTLTVIVVTLVAAAGGALSVLVAYGMWRADPSRVWRFLGLFGLLLGSLSTATTVLAGTTVLGLPPCV